MNRETIDALLTNLVVLTVGELTLRRVKLVEMLRVLRERLVIVLDEASCNQQRFTGHYAGFYFCSTLGIAR